MIEMILIAIRGKRSETRNLIDSRVLFLADKIREVKRGQNIVHLYPSKIIIQ